MAPDPAVFVSLGVSALSAVVFLAVGRAVVRRPVSPELKNVRDAFGLWWFGFGTTSLVGVAQVVVFVLRGSEAWAALNTLTVVYVLALCAALWGLVYYLTVLYTNSQRIRWPLAVAYGAFSVALVYLIFTIQARDYFLDGYVLTSVQAQSLQGSVLLGGFIVALLLPQMLAALAYLSLYPKVQDPVQRRRIVMVGLSILLWFGTGFVSLVPGASHNPAWQLASRLVGLSAAGVIYYAYTRLGGKPEPGPREVPRAG